MCIKGLTQFLGDNIEFDIPREGPSWAVAIARNVVFYFVYSLGRESVL